MTTSKHTPGEWYAQQTLINVGDEVSWAVLCEKDLNAGYVVAMCYGPDAEANAQAIVRAEATNKQLLEACRAAIHFLSDAHWIPIPDWGDIEYLAYDELCDVIIAAIAKATGGSDE